MITWLTYCLQLSITWCWVTRIAFYVFITAYWLSLCWHEAGLCSISLSLGLLKIGMGKSRVGSWNRIVIFFLFFFYLSVTPGQTSWCEYITVKLYNLNSLLESYAEQKYDRCSNNHFTWILGHGSVWRISLIIGFSWDEMKVISHILSILY